MPTKTAKKSAKAPVKKPKKTVARKTSTKKIEKSCSEFAWKSSTAVEKCGFALSLVFLGAAIVFLVFEFLNEAEDWPYAWFDVTIGLSFISETFVHWNYKRSLGIVTLVCGILFVVLGVLKIFGAL